MVRVKLFEKLFGNSNSPNTNNTGAPRLSGNRNASKTTKPVNSNSSNLQRDDPDEQQLLLQPTQQKATTSTMSNLLTELDEDDEATRLNEPSVFQSILNENLVCNCCLELLQNPVTLMCGHSFCQLCLADWFLISNNRRCPICRQEWYGVPKQNQMLRAIILRLDHISFCK